MHSRRTAIIRRVAVGAGTVLLAGGLTPVAAHANPAGTGLVISEVYGGGNDGTTALPTPDVTGTLGLSASSGAVVLSSAGTTVGTPGPQNSSNVASPDGPVIEAVPDQAFTEADNATAVFSIVVDGAPGVVTPIADIQGTGPASELAGATVTTEGVVTAAYRAGGFDGFYIQTGGPDTTPDASDGLFVYQPSFDTDVVRVGDTVAVTGEVKEFGGLTQVAPGGGGSVVATAAQPAVRPKTVIPGSDCALPGDGCLAGAALDEAREAVEGELFAPAPMTVTDAYDFGVTSSSFYGEIGLAAESSIPLITPTEVIDAQDTAAIAARTRYNNAHLLVLDDASSTNYTAGGRNDAVPWLTRNHSVRVGAKVTFDEPVVLDYRFGWKLQPRRQVVGKPSGLVTIEQDRPETPAYVGGDLTLATFNVLNYFTTFGGDVAGCTSYNDKDGNPISTRSCPGSTGPRGAWNQASFERQQTKIVKAINTMDADVVSLEELENSNTVDGADRDEAIGALVAALNADAGSTRWAYVPSPATVPASEDVIRTGFIYDPATVETVGDGEILRDAAFDNARDPLAQVFKARDGAAEDRFAVIVNHFKSKGSGTDDGTGQGNANPDRIAQAEALTVFAQAFSASRDTDAVFLTGDFNAYSMEDPVQVIEDAGYTALESTDDPQEESYSFAGTSGSLDHIFANAAAEDLVDGVDIWEINSNESVYYQYSRYNSLGTLLYSPDVFGASDHNPEIVGISVADLKADSSVSASVTPGSIKAQTDTATIAVEVTSAGATPTGLVVASVDGVIVGGGELVDGRADVVVGPFAAAGAKQVTVAYRGDAATLPAETTVGLTVTPAPVVERDPATVVAAIAPPSVVVNAGSAALAVRVSKASGTPTGAVLAMVDGVVVGAATLEDGTADISVAPFSSVGTKTIDVRYFGDRTTKPAAGTARLEVVRAKPRLKVKAPKRAVHGKRVRVKVVVRAPGHTPTGKVAVKLRGTKIIKTLRNGRTRVWLKLPRLGRSKVRVRYRGDDLTEPARTSVRIRVRRR